MADVVSKAVDAVVPAGYDAIRGGLAIMGGAFVSKFLDAGLSLALIKVPYISGGSLPAEFSAAVIEAGLAVWLLDMSTARMSDTNAMLYSIVFIGNISLPTQFGNSMAQILLAKIGTNM